MPALAALDWCATHETKLRIVSEELSYSRYENSPCFYHRFDGASVWSLKDTSKLAIPSWIASELYLEGGILWNDDFATLLYFCILSSSNLP
jgi:hypothetical protein